MERPLTRAEFTAALRGLRTRYWDSHPFHLRVHAGEASPEDIRRWVANRWYYQRCLAQKNAAIIANCPDPEIRRRWVERISFHDGISGDGTSGREGGLGDWLALGAAVGLTDEELIDERHVLRGTRFAVDGYLTFCLTRPWWESAAAALTELFSADHMTDRVQAWRRHYDWIKPDGMAYFEKRIPQVREDASYTLDLVLRHCESRERQDTAIAALGFKCDVLGAMLDAIDYAGRR